MSQAERKFIRDNFDVAIRAKLTGKGGRGRVFYATAQQMTDARGDLLHLVACRIGVPADSVQIVSIEAV